MAYRKRRGSVAPASGAHPSGSRAASGADLAPAVLTIAQQLKQLLGDVESIKKRLTTLEAQTAAPPLQTTPMVEQAREVVLALQRILSTGPAPRTPASSTPSAPTPSAQAAPPEVQSRPIDAPTTKLPWMTAANPKSPAQLVPKWTLWSSHSLDRLNSYVERSLDNVPDGVAKLGETQAAEKMREWIASDKPLALRVAALISRRIVATPPTARASAQQRLDLAQAAARDLAESHPSDPPDDRESLASFLQQNPRLPVLLGIFLTAALRNLEEPPDAPNL